MTDVLTYHNDMARTGQATNEQILTPANVNSNQFGKLWFLPTDQKVYAQPLYVAGVSIPGKGVHNVVFVETQNDSAYAFDADSTNVFWHVSLLGDCEEPFQTNGCTISPEIGITATPVIDRQLGPNGTIFIEAMSQNCSNGYFQRLYALDLATGQSRVAPVVITASFPGNGDGSSGGIDYFIGRYYVERACLTLVNGVVYTAWSAHCDEHPAGSWVIGFDEKTLVQTNAVNMEPNASWGSMWNSGGGPAADTNGNLYVVLGNGYFNNWEGSLNAQGFPVDGDLGNSFVKLSITNNKLTAVDYFAMYNAYDEDEEDMDLGSGSALVLPAMTNAQGSTRHLVVTAGKDQNLYLANSTNMGKYNPNNNNALYQELNNVFADVSNAPPNAYGTTGGVFSSGAYFNGTLYFGPNNSHIQALPFTNALLSTTSSQSSTLFAYPGATPCISANGVSNAIVWAMQLVGTGGQSGPGTGAVLHAYSATNLAVEYYNSSQAASNRDAFGTAQKFVPPIIASARVYAATTNGVAVFGLLNQSSLTPIEQWRNGWFGNPSNVGAGANSACPAGDGVPNLIKYFLGLNPFTPVVSEQLVSAGILQANGQSYLTLTVNRAANPTDVTYLAEVSSDVQIWNSSPSGTTTLTNTATQLVIQNNTPVGAGTNEFLRLLITPVSNP